MKQPVGAWNEHVFGNHRAVIEVAAPGDAVRVRLLWRRRDQKPDQKNVVVVDATANLRILNVVCAEIDREHGEIVFQPVSAPGKYFVYFLPFTGNVKSSYPRCSYLPPEDTADAAWRARNKLTPDSLPKGEWKKLPCASFVSFESIDTFSAFTPMEIIATKEETDRLVAKHEKAPFLLFAEDRDHSIRLFTDLPYRWIERGAFMPLRSDAQRGEFYVFQIGVYACREPLRSLRVTFTPLAARASRVTVPVTAFRCFNLAGNDSTGTPFTKTVNVEKGKVQPLWCGIQLPPDLPSGEYDAIISVAAEGTANVSVPIALAISAKSAHAAGDDEPARLSRLRWLDSTLALDEEVIKPFTPVQVDGRTLGVLGREVELGPGGLPVQIQSFFAPEITHLNPKGRDLLAAPIRLVVADERNKPIPARATAPVITRQAPGAACWEASATAGSIEITMQGRIECDGSIEATIAVRARKAVKLGDIRLELPIAKRVAKYMMGLGLRGGARPALHDWKWSVKTNQDCVWIGDVNAGIQVMLKDDKYVRPLNTNFYHQQPLVMPASWANDGKGGIRCFEDGNVFMVECYSGPRVMKAGEVQHYRARFLVTPFKTIDPKAHFSTRFFHSYKPPSEVVAAGSNVINIHHANEINPFINYPFLRAKEMKAYIDEAHKLGCRVKIYYTVRELTNRAPELFALCSLGHEVFSDGPGNGYAWLQEHLDSNHIAAWFVPELKDAAVINTGGSRWHNFYIEGLDWLARNLAIDGIYLDDVAFDRTITKRVRKVLDHRRPNALIDLHSANQFNPSDGFANSAGLYLDHLPYVDRLWFGEYFDYNMKPDFWMVEVAGIPFGLMGEMLQDGGNPWRGMLYGMTCRMPYNGNPKPLWEAWDAFGIHESRMVGFWSPNCPVSTGRDDVLATAYIRPKGTMISIASWASEPVEIKLSIDWKALGLHATKVKMVAPAIANFQDAAAFKPGAKIRIEPGKGLLLRIR